MSVILNSMIPILVFLKLLLTFISIKQKVRLQKFFPKMRPKSVMYGILQNLFLSFIVHFTVIYNGSKIWLIWFINQRVPYNHALSVVRRHHLCIPLLATGVNIETSYLEQICNYAPNISPSDISFRHILFNGSRFGNFLWLCILPA